MKKNYFNYEEHYYLFKMLYEKYNVSMDDIAIILYSNSFTIRKYLKEWGLYNNIKAKNKNKIGKDGGGWNKLRKLKICENCGRVGKCDRAHIISRKDGGSFKKTNVLILCPNCHGDFDDKIIDL